MGLLDPPAFPLNQPRAPVGAAITTAMKDDKRDVNILIISDSTGVDQRPTQGSSADPRWPYLLAEDLRIKFPSYTVKYKMWDNVSETNYGAETTLSPAGTGLRTLTIWNAAKSGATASYWNGRFISYYSNIAPTTVPMDLVIVSDGHNEAGTGFDTAFRARYLGLLKHIKQYVPGVPIALLTQNPQNGSGTVSTPTEESNQLLRMEQIRQIANSDGLGLIDITPAFLNDANWRTTLTNADGVHPTSSGSILWAQEVAKHFPAKYDAATTANAGPIPRAERVWVPATSFIAVEGSPTLTNVNGHPVWSLPSLQQSSISCSTDWPGGWQSVRIFVISSTPSTNTATPWRGRILGRQQSGTHIIESGAGQTLSAGSTGSTLSILPRSSANTVLVTAFAGGTSGVNSLTGYTGRPMMFQIQRLGNDALDTLADVAYIVGMSIERIS